MTGLLGDLRTAVRGARRQPLFAAVVLATLAVSIGAATTVFSLFDAVLLRPFPYREPERLVRLRTEEPGLAGSLRDASLPDFQDWREASRSYASMAAYVSSASTLTGRGPARSVSMTFATPPLFETMGVHPYLGRTFTEYEDQLGGDVRKVVLGYGLWHDLFGARPDVLGQAVQLRGQVYTVVGVMPAGFAFPGRSEVWAPLMARYTSNQDNRWRRRDTRVHSVIARLAPGVTLNQAGSEMDALCAELGRRYADTNRNVHSRVAGLRDSETADIRSYLLTVGAGVLLLLLIGCVNVANLFIARAAARERELALRAALGSSAWRILRQLVAEGVLYGLLGGAVGAGLAALGVAALRWLIPVDLPAWMSFSIDARVLSFCLLVSFLTAVVFGLLPGLQYVRRDLAGVLKAGGRGASPVRGISHRLRRGLVVAEMALSLVLLLTAGLLLRSFTRVMSVDMGFRTDGLAVVRVGRYVPSRSREELVRAYSDEYGRIRDRLAALPGVVAVSAGDDIPFLDRKEDRGAHEIYTRQRSVRELAYRGPADGADVMPGYFGALGVPILEGRDFTEADDLRAPGVVIVSRRTAETLFPGRSAIGEEIRWGTDSDFDPWMRIVGVVGDTRWQPAQRKTALEVYWSYRQYPWPSTQLLVRTSVDPDSLLPALRRVAQDTNPDVVVERVTTMRQMAAESIWQRRLWGFLLGFFALLALGVASVGLYGVLSYIVVQRTREIGIRMAVGATAAGVLRLVLGQGMALVSVGAGLGAVGGMVVNRGVASLLFGIGPFDPPTCLGVTAILMGVGFVACAAPAWRAARISPLVALRDD